MMARPSALRRAMRVKRICASLSLSEEVGSSMMTMRAGWASALAISTDRKSTRLNSSHLVISYAVFCLKKNNTVLHARIAPLLLHRAPQPDRVLVVLHGAPVP